MSRPTLAIYGIQDRHDKDFPWFVHDHSVALMADGKVLKHLQLERVSRRKRDNRLPELLHELVKSEGLIAADPDLIFVDNVVGRSFISKQGNIRFEIQAPGFLLPYAEQGRAWWYDHFKPAWMLNHELAHLYSSVPFFGSFRENSLLIHFDGGASVCNFSAWIYKGGQLRNIEYHWKLKEITSLFNANALSFSIIGSRMKDQNSLPGKLMGFAAYGKYRPELESWLRKHSFFHDIWDSKTQFFIEAEKFIGQRFHHFDQHNPFLQDIAACFQEVFQKEFLALIEGLQNRYHCDYLYYSGGSALNIPLNYRLIQKGWFKEVFIPPCPDDSGLALGAAVWLELKKKNAIAQHSAYLNNWGLNETKIDYSPEDIREVADQIIQGKVTGLCNGAGEIGPRALGNRSILALPGSVSLAKKISMDMKGREWYRPVAPVMLQRNIPDYTGLNKIPRIAKFLLLEFPVLPDKQKEIEGVVHINGTSRIQAIEKREENPYLFDLLDYLEKEYGIKALINTSFNSKGEPIVHTAEDARKSAKKMQLDVLIVNGKTETL